MIPEPKFSVRQFAVVAIVGLLCLSVVAGVAVAQEQRTGGTVTVAADETHDGDLEITAGTADIEGTVDGDLTVTGGAVTISGTVTGDVTATAGTVVVAGEIEGDLTSTAGVLDIDENGTVAGNVDATGGTMQLEGAVGETVRFVGDELIVGSAASVGGDLEYDADDADISGEATVGGDVTERDDLGEPPFSDISVPEIPDSIASLLFGLYVIVANLLLGAILFAAAPTFSEEVADRGIDRPLLSGGVGFASMIAGPVLVVLAFVSIVGIPLGMLGSWGYFAVLWIGFVYGALVVGDYGLSRAGYDNRWLALTVGLVLVIVLGALPYVSVLLLGVLWIGLGAFVLSVYDRRVGVDDEDAESTAHDRDDSDDERPVVSRSEPHDGSDDGNRSDELVGDNRHGDVDNNHPSTDPTDGNDRIR